MKVDAIISKFIKKDRNNFVTFDMGSGYLKALCIEDCVVTKAFFGESGGQPVETFSNWLKKEDLLSCPIRMAVKGENTLVRYVPFPRMDKKKVKDVFGYEITRFVPFKKEDIYFDVFVIDEEYSDKEMLVLLAVAKKDFIDALLKSFQTHKLQIQQITLNTIALLNLFSHYSSKQDNTALIDIGVHSTLLNLTKGGIPYLSREIKIPADNLIDRATKTDKVNGKKGSGKVVSSGSRIKTMDSSENKKALEDFCYELSEEIKDSFDYFEANWGQTTQTILLTGGISEADRITETIKNVLGVEVKKWNCLEGSSLEYMVDLKPHELVLATALGLGT